MQNNDGRSAFIYDALNRWAADDDFFLALANETPRARVLDLGCGTGRLTLALARAGHVVTGIDPDAASLRAARMKRGADQVTWQVGTSTILPQAAFDLALMTSHVAQVFVDDTAWAASLTDLRRALATGGRLAFDMRDPTARAWERWNLATTTAQAQLPDGSRVRVWVEVEHVADGLVTVQEHTLDLDTDRTEISSATLRFRTEQELRSSLAAAGFTIEHIFGGWNREAVGQGAGELIVIARA
jgi:SAM-dependent methyltransferase